MKKLILLAVAALLAVPGFAQIEPVYTSSDGNATFDVLGHIGYGYHITKSRDFNPGWCDEFILNLVKFGLFPTEHLGLELGADLQVNDFNSREKAFVQHDGFIHVGDFSELDMAATVDRKRSDFTVVGLGAPVQVKVKFEKVAFGIGAVASWNFAGATSYWYEKGNRSVSVNETQAKVNSFSYAVLATASCGAFGLYFKYYPQYSRILPEGSVDVSFVTVGISLGL